MAENSVNSIRKNIINVSRNTPVALVVGAAGFLGSHLSDKLLDKEIQVIGLDNFKTGKKENLQNAIKQNKFHLIESQASDFDLEIDRLDYIFIVSGSGWNLDSILKKFSDKKSRLLFVSSIELYDEGESDNLKWFKNAESKIARYAKENNLNARVLRLSVVYGPRMHFREKDPIIKIIKKTILEKEYSVSDFSTRAIYVSDAIDLIIKCIMVGSTAQKVFDGSLYQPIKIDDVKQILLDPVWYEQKDFKAQELPPWTTPNLSKTMHFLNWHPKVNLVAALKETLSYFKDNEIKIEDEENEEKKVEFDENKKNELNEFKKDEKVEKEDKFSRGAIKGNFKLKILNFKFPKGAFLVFLITLLISYALLLPMFKLGWGILTFRYQLSSAFQNLNKGNFEGSLQNISQAQAGLDEAKIILDSLESIKKLGWFSSHFDNLEKISSLSKLSILAAKESILGVQFLYSGLRSVTGELTDKPKDYFLKAQVELEKAYEDISIAQTIISDDNFKKQTPQFLKVDSLAVRLNEYSNMVASAKAVSLLLPKIVSEDGGVKTYLLLFQNNMELRPTGGFIGSFGKLTFEGGKLKKLEVSDIYEIDGQLNLHIEPPKEIKEDLGQKDWFLRDSNWESDFPTSAKQAEWFFNKETGEQVAGVLALDISSMEKILKATGPIDLADYNEKITSENLFQKSITHAEVSFFPGSKNKKNFLTAISSGLFTKLFFVPQPNWPEVISAIGQSLKEKHISIFLDDAKLFSYLISQNWTGMLPRSKIAKKGEYFDFLAPVEANLGANKANYYLKRNYSLETSLGKEGDIKSRLRINYTNTSPTNTWPAGLYKNRMRIYLPFGTKLTRVLWGEKDKTADIESFVDYGRSGFSILLELLPRETKMLVLDYQLPAKLNFENGMADYKLDVVKQAGTLHDPFEWRITYPLNYQVVSTPSKNLNPQEISISTDLSEDRSFEVRFKK